MMKKRFFVVVFAIMMLFCLVVPEGSASAANPYSDVTRAKVGDSAYKAISFLKSRGAFKDVITSKRFYPNKKVTRREFLTVLGNLYGDNNVPASFKDVRYANKTITAQFACNRLVALAKQLGVTITWKGPATALTRATMTRYVKIFWDFDEAFQR